MPCQFFYLPLQLVWHDKRREHAGWLACFYINIYKLVLCYAVHRQQHQT